MYALKISNIFLPSQSGIAFERERFLAIFYGLEISKIGQIRCKGIVGDFFMPDGGSDGRFEIKLWNFALLLPRSQRICG